MSDLRMTKMPISGGMVIYGRYTEGQLTLNDGDLIELPVNENGELRIAGGSGDGSGGGTGRDPGIGSETATGDQVTDGTGAATVIQALKGALINDAALLDLLENTGIAVDATPTVNAVNAVESAVSSLVSVTTDDIKVSNAAIQSALEGVLTVSDSAVESAINAVSAKLETTLTVEDSAVESAVNAVGTKLEATLTVEDTATKNSVDAVTVAINELMASRTQTAVSVAAGTDVPVTHDVTKHKTCKASVVVPAGATASYVLEDAVLSGDTDGEVITESFILEAGKTNYINAPAFDGVSLIFKFTSDAALTVNISSH